MRPHIKLISRRVGKHYDIVVCTKKSNSRKYILDSLGSVGYSGVSKQKLVTVNMKKFSWWIFHGASLSKSLNFLVDINKDGITK